MKRPDLTYITQAEIIAWTESADGLHKYYSITKEGKMVGFVGTTEQTKQLIENLPALVQIAEMFHDSLLGEHENGLPFQIVSQTLKNLQNER